MQVASSYCGTGSCVCGGILWFLTHLLIGSNDALLTGITNGALESSGINYKMAMTGNWYFMIASTFLLTIVGSIVTHKITEPRLGKYTGDYVPENKPLTAQESKGLRNAMISLLVFVGLLAIMLVPENGALRSMDPVTGAMTITEFMNNGFIFAILLLFLIPSATYGVTIGEIKNSSDLVTGMTEVMKSMAGYIVLAFFAAQFINYFSFTNLGTILSVNGALFLESISFTGFPLIMRLPY